MILKKTFEFEKLFLQKELLFTENRICNKYNFENKKNFYEGDFLMSIKEHYK